MTDKQRKICEDLGWEVYETEDDIELRKCSSLGEDFGFSVKADKFLEDLRDYYEDFDAEEHAAMWYNARNNVRGVPQSLRALWMTRLKSTECLKICALSYPDPKSKEESEL